MKIILTSSSHPLHWEYCTVTNEDYIDIIKSSVISRIFYGYKWTWCWHHQVIRYIENILGLQMNMMLTSSSHPLHWGYCTVTNEHDVNIIKSAVTLRILYSYKWTWCWHHQVIRYIVDIVRLQMNMMLTSSSHPLHRGYCTVTNEHDVDIIKSSVTLRIL